MRSTTFLFPSWCRAIGLAAIGPFVALFIAAEHFEFSPAFLTLKDTQRFPWFDTFLGGPQNFTDEIATVGGILSLMMIAFSRLRHEDEYVSYLRLQSLQLSVNANYAIFLLLDLLVYGGNFLSIVIYNVPTVLVLFIFIFNYNLYLKPKIQNTLAHEESN